MNPIDNYDVANVLNMIGLLSYVRHTIQHSPVLCEFKLIGLLYVFLNVILVIVATVNNYYKLFKLFKISFYIFIGIAFVLYAFLLMGSQKLGFVSMCFTYASFIEYVFATVCHYNKKNNKMKKVILV